MNETYIYPHNLKSQAKLWFWNLRDVAIIGVALLISILALTQIKFFLPLALTLVYMFLSIQLDDTSVLDFIKQGVKYFLLTQQYGKIAKEYYGYNVAVIDLRNPTKSDGNNLLHLVNKYMDLWKKEPDNLAYKAKAEKYAKIISKTIIMSGMDGASFGQNAFFYDAAEGLLTASILMVAEFCPPETRHIVSVFKIIQDLLAPSGTRGKTQFQLLVSRLPEEHKARWFAGAALNTSEQAMSSVMSTALSRLNAFLDSELEQILCFDTAIDAEKFCSAKSAIFIVLPEEDTSKHFMVSLIVQQMYREILAVADENDGRLKNRVMMYLDEFGTIPKIEGAEMMFSASRSRRVSIVAIIQSFAQLQKNYGKEGCEIITDNTQLTVFGGFAPNSESAQVLSKALGSRTVQSGSVNRGKNDPSQSLQMIERALLTPDELKSLPKGTFVVMKTGFHPMQVKLKLFFKWGIVFPKEIYAVADKGNRKVSYANKSNLEDTIVMLYSTQSVSEKMTEEERATHRPGPDRRNRTDMAFSPRKPGRKPKTETDDDDDAEKGDSMPMSQSNIPAGEETEIIINEKGDIVDERIRNDLPG